MVKYLIVFHNIQGLIISQIFFESPMEHIDRQTDCSWGWRMGEASDVYG
jgi:hypothetical protein